MSGYPVRWNGVSHAYGGLDVVRGVTLAIEPGESVALLGHNGAGKTTLTRMLMGLVRPRAGTVSVGDWDVATKRPDQMAARVGYAFQHADQQLFARSVREDVSFGPRQFGTGRDAIAEALDALNLGRVAGRHPYDLPAPVRKLVALAGVLAMRPGVLVLDEPTAGFDRTLRETVLRALRSRLEEGVTVVVVSHDLSLVRALARREIVLEAGAVVRDEALAAS